MKSKTQYGAANGGPRQIEADKTSRLRALRLAKEAEDREAAARDAAAKLRKPARGRGREARPSDQPK
jgi:hypothetical protein